MYFLFLIRTDLVQNAKLNEDKSALARSLQDEQARYVSLKGKMLKLKNSSYIELKARGQLGMVGQGEKAYKVIFK